jgi:prepilin-type N-terminal cleavage/methylation domain-containing protein
MKQRSKKGFSLIELIVVIAVIAAIAAVIVPQFSSMSEAARIATDRRNVQLWNEAYVNAYAVKDDLVSGSTLAPSLTGTNKISDISITYKIGGVGDALTMSAKGFTLQSTSSSLGFKEGEGLTLTTTP